MKNVKIGPLFGKCLFKFLLVITLLFTFSCKYHPVDKKIVNKDSIKQAKDTLVSNIKIPDWLIGTWKGEFLEDQYSMNIKFIVVITVNGRITQTSIVPGEEDEVLTGKCISISNDELVVNFNNEENNTIFYLNKKRNLLGISGSNWLKKQ